ncbi:hypothetical protein CMV_027162 [Castanea mollissima]|uniref:Tubulin-tyrosine ligase n=1 Tax=Castanea mollissima TaxID=60419 RepID=A0A8J4V310_9ROSI|nr:hypothetical protein CMV_027162 [Castanea mollissima]
MLNTIGLIRNLNFRRVQRARPPSSSSSTCTQFLEIEIESEHNLTAMAEDGDRGKRITRYSDFVKVHGLLLAASGLPQSLHFQLFQKLTSETFDGGAHFSIEPTSDGRQRRLLLTSSDSMAKESHVFLIDHAWTFRLSDAYKQLQEVSGLAERMAALMCVDVDLNSNAEETEEVVDGVSHQNGTKLSVFEAMESEIHGAKEIGDGTVRWLELDELDIDDDTFLSLELSTRFPGLLALSLCGNKLENVEIIAREVTKFEQLRALWLNNNPVVKNCDSQLENRVLQGLPRLEIYNSRFTAKFGAWALGFCGGVYGKDNPVSIHEGDHQLESVSSLDLSDRCIHNLISKAFSPVELPSLSYLNIRGNPLEQNSVAVLLEVLKEFPCLQSLEVDIPGPLGESAIDILESLPKLSELNGVNASKILDTGKHVIDSVLQPRLPEWTAEEPVTDRIISAMWLYLMTYRLADEEKIDETSVWYVMDELGSALRHNDEPNFRVAPFLFMPEGNLASAVSFSILWPTQNVKKGDECTRNFLFGIGEDKQRSARLSAWFHTPQNYFINEYEKLCQKLQSKSLISPSVQFSTTRSIHHTDGSPLRVYTDLPHVEEFLTRSEFVIISEPKDADIVWTSTQVDEDMKKAAGITDQQYINQFPFEACLVMKHHLAETVHKAYGSSEWLQPTYNLETHLSQLIGDYYAISNVGEVIQFYDSDRRFPALGFGGRTCDWITSHCFNLNGSASAFKLALMRVDIDLNSNAEETEEVVDGISHQNGTKLSVFEAMESEIHGAKEIGDGTVRWLELDELDIDDDTFLSLDLSSRFPGLLALSLCGNKLENVEIIAREVTKFEQLRALWLNNNPVVKNCDSQLENRVLQGLPRLEIYNSRFTAKFGAWALGFCGGVYGKDNPGSIHEGDHQLESVSSLDLSDRCIHNLISTAFSPVELPSLSYLNIRGNPLERNSVAVLLEVLKEFPCLQSLEVDIPGPLGESAIDILESLPKLSELNGVNASKILDTGKHVIDSVLQPHEEKIDETSVWYVMDELGSALRHNDEPNFRVAPFLFMPEGNLASAVSFSILWPTQNLKKEMNALVIFFLVLGRTNNVLPDFQLEEFLTRLEFVIISEPKDADIVWTSTQVDEDMKKAAGITDQQYINEFPFEAYLVMKHHLAETVHKAYGSPEWLQPTYNLETHLSQLIGDYYVRKRDGLDNLWILKPWNMARTIDTTVTDNLSSIIRHMETGPKICQKYIEHPALFNGKKFDLRYIVLVRSINPLEIFLSDVFWVRLANNQYSLDKHSFFEYETHFTVMVCSMHNG